MGSLRHPAGAATRLLVVGLAFLAATVFAAPSRADDLIQTAASGAVSTATSAAGPAAPEAPAAPATPAPPAPAAANVVDTDAGSQVTNAAAPVVAPATTETADAQATVKAAATDVQATVSSTPAAVTRAAHETLQTAPAPVHSVAREVEAAAHVAVATHVHPASTRVAVKAPATMTVHQPEHRSASAEKVARPRHRDRPAATRSSTAVRASTQKVTAADLPRSESAAPAESTPVPTAPSSHPAPHASGVLGAIRTVHAARPPRGHVASGPVSPQLVASSPVVRWQPQRVRPSTAVDAPAPGAARPHRLPGPPVPTGGGGLSPSPGGTAGTGAVAAVLIGLLLLVLPRLSRWLRLAQDLAPAPVLLAALERPG